MILLTSCLAYLIGAFPISEVIFRRKYLYIANNVGHNQIDKQILLFVGCDLGKGALATTIALLLAGWFAASVAAILVVFGSMYSIFLGMRGGSGVATAGGALIVLSPLLIFIGMVIYVCSYLTTKYTFFSTILTFAALLLLGFFLVSNIHVWLVILAVGVLLLIPSDGNRHQWRQDMAAIRSGKIKR